ncbi:hypothetical protein ACFQXA_31625 [Nocardiopsis composta]
MNLGAQGNVTVSGKYDKSTWYTDPKNIQTSETFSWTGSGSLGATVLAGHADGELSWGGGTRIMRNQDGSLANIRYIANAEGSYNIGIDKQNERKNKDGLDGGGISAGKKQTKSVNQMVQLDFDTPEEQAAGEALLKEHGPVPRPTSPTPWRTSWTRRTTAATSPRSPMTTPPRGTRSSTGRAAPGSTPPMWRPTRASSPPGSRWACSSAAA